MSSPRIQRQVRQQRADIASVYELLDEVRGPSQASMPRPTQGSPL